MVQAACVLHNLVKGHPYQVGQPRTSKTPGKKPTFFSLRLSKARPGALAPAVRKRLCNFFSAELFQWQNKEALERRRHLQAFTSYSMLPWAAPRGTAVPHHSSFSGRCGSKRDFEMKGALMMHLEGDLTAGRLRKRTSLSSLQFAIIFLWRSKS